MDGAEIPFEELQIEELQIGSGGFGMVFKALHHGTMVAVKKVAGVHQSDVDKETTMLVNLASPNVVQYFGTSFDPAGYLCIVMELMDQSLFRYLQEGDDEHPWTAPQGEPLPWRTVCKLVTQIARALVFIHSKQIVHADLKSHNVLLEFADGKNPSKVNTDWHSLSSSVWLLVTLAACMKVKLCDLGLSRIRNLQIAPIELLL